MSESLFSARQQALARQLASRGLHALAVVPGASMRYLSGLEFHLSERPVVAFFGQEGPPAMALPELEEGKLRGLPFAARAWTYGEDPATWSKAFREAARAAGLDGKRVGVESGNMRVLELRLLQEALPEATYPDGSEALAALRICKDAEEIACMRRAAQMAEEAMRQTLPAIEAGMTERDAASLLTARLFAAGCAPELPFSPIVAFGASSANPHATPGERALRPGDLILCDWGAQAGGYFSDMTRMFTYGEAGPAERRIVEIVDRARQAATQAAGPDALASEVDRAARAVIEEAGFGDRFIHRTGHGLGLEIHEPPWIRDGNAMRLRPGMTFTIEPGIYLPGAAGARIEDMVTITEDGTETLTTLPRGLTNIAG